MADKSVIDLVRKYLRTLSDSGLTPSFGVLFGSYLTGDAHEWSDIDLMVVAKRYDQDYEHKDVTLLWGTAALVDSRIEPIPCGEKQWVEDDETHVIEIARREGEIIYFRDSSIN